MCKDFAPSIIAATLCGVDTSHSSTDRNIGDQAENTMQISLVLLCLLCAVSSGTPESNQTVPRLRVENYPDLPSNVAAVLQSRRCTIPQPNPHGPARNVIRGEFFRKGQKGWAVICSSGGNSSILVFRDGEDRSPDQIAESRDDHFIIDTAASKLYLREISTADEKFILRHYRAYGGLKPPKIDHDGIDDAFLEKASVTWYWNKGKWQQLQGAD